MADRLNAAACALVSCAASIPVDDERYAAFKDLQDRGAGYGAEISLLQATGQFGGRDWVDRSDDLINAHGQARQIVGASADAATGVAGGLASYIGMAATAPACVGVITCALPAGLGALGTHSMVGAWDSASGITADFKSGEPDRVAASFYPETFPGESSATGDLAVGAGKSAAQLLLFGAAGKLFGGGLGGGAATVGSKEVVGVPKSPNVTSAITDAEAGTSGLPKLGSLKGEPELPPKNASPDMVRSIERQNEASKKLAQAGFDVEQLANTGRKGGNPDLRINGDLADVFSPRTNSPISVLMTVTEKVEKQASSVVVNLADSPLTFGEIEKALLSRPVEGLKKLYLMKNNEFRVIEASK